MAFVKLSDGPVTMTVGGVRMQESKFGMQFVFSEAGGITEVGVSEGAGNRALGYLNLTPETAVGKTLKFEQVKKDGKTYTNIHLAREGEASAPAAASARAAGMASSGAMSREDAAELYIWALNHANETLGKLCALDNIPLDASALQSAAATLFIAVKGK